MHQPILGVLEIAAAVSSGNTCVSCSLNGVAAIGTMVNRHAMTHTPPPSVAQRCLSSSCDRGGFVADVILWRALAGPAAVACWCLTSAPEAAAAVGDYACRVCVPPQPCMPFSHARLLPHCLQHQLAAGAAARHHHTNVALSSFSFAGSVGCPVLSVSPVTAKVTAGVLLLPPPSLFPLSVCCITRCCACWALVARVRRGCVWTSRPSRRWP
jgi:hypothetical protein